MNYPQPSAPPEYYSYNLSKGDKKMNLGKWICKNLYKYGKSNRLFEREAKLSTGTLDRWSNGQDPRLKSCLKAWKLIARVKKQPLERVILESLEEHPDFWRGR